MAKEQSPKFHPSAVDARRQKISWILTAAGLCFFFYILGAYQSQGSSDRSLKINVPCPTIGEISDERSLKKSPREDERSLEKPARDDERSLDFAAHHGDSDNEQRQSPSNALESCPLSMTEYTPCEDTERSLKFNRDRLIYRERHCPTKDERLRCLVPAPPGYRNPFPWPRSRELAWYANVPHKELTIEKAVQNWIQFEGGDKFRFPGGGTMFPRGAAAYIDDIAALIPFSKIRTALDTGCGVASFGAYLLSRNVLTMSFAPRDTHEGQVQFALERGVPAMLAVLASQRLLYPARAFDMAHCSRCLIPWKDYEGVYLMEVDRVLRPGGYWVLSGPPVNWKTHWKGWQRTQEDLNDEMTAIEAMAKSLCWKKIVEKGNLAIWQKPTNHFDCLRNKRHAQMCDAQENADYAWYKPMQTCITRLPESERMEVSGGALVAWPNRVTAVPPRISRGEVPEVDTPEAYNADTALWKERVDYYKSVIPLGQGRYRNIMDMDAGIGGFAAALASDNRVWVMNAVHPNATSSLGVVYERGLIGAYHDWCEAFSTYPRTYDLIHANRVFSSYKSRNNCDMEDILVEMDRILRPEGSVVIRDEVDVLNIVQRITNGMKWESKMVDHESGPFNREKILVAVKSYWVGNSTTV